VAVHAGRPLLVLALLLHDVLEVLALPESGQEFVVAGPDVSGMTFARVCRSLSRPS